MIPKTISPGTLDDIRTILITILWSKILESYVSTFTCYETKDNWKKNQYRGRKGARNSRASLSRQKTEGEQKEDTQLLSIYSGKCTTKCWLSLKNGSTMFSDNSFKLLGFMFSSKPDVRSQINPIVNPVSSRCFVY